MCIQCQVRKEGRQARLLGLSIACCPYPEDRRVGLAWVRGWVEEDTEFVEVARALELQSIRQGRIQ